MLMNTRSVTIAAVVFILIIAGMFGYAYLKRSELERTPVPVPQESTEVDPYSSITRIDAKHFFIEGMHTLVGEILMPTACDLLDWDAFVAESMPEQVTVDFKIINESDRCAAVVTAQRFKVDFTASEDAQMRARINGREVELNIIPGAPGETPDTFELFQKG